MTELLAELTGTTFVASAAVNTPKNLIRAKKLIRRAFEAQLNTEGYGFVELLSSCPTNWKMSPLEAWQWIDKEMTKRFPLGVIKDTTGDKDAN